MSRLASGRVMVSVVAGILTLACAVTPLPSRADETETAAPSETGVISAPSVKDGQAAARMDPIILKSDGTHAPDKNGIDSPMRMGGAASRQPSGPLPPTVPAGSMSPGEPLPPTVITIVTVPGGESGASLEGRAGGAETSIERAQQSLRMEKALRNWSSSDSGGNVILVVPSPGAGTTETDTAADAEIRKTLRMRLLDKYDRDHDAKAKVLIAP